MLCGCTTHPHFYDDSKIIHTVMIWLEEPNNKTHTEKIIKTTLSLIEIPEVQEIRVGKVLPSNRPIVDDSFDIGLYMLFNDQEALETYLVHPIHMNAVKSVLRPFSKKILVYDFKAIYLLKP